MDDKKSNVLQMQPAGKSGSEKNTAAENVIDETLVELLLPHDFDDAHRHLWIEVATVINEAGRLNKKTVLAIKTFIPILKIYRDILTEIANGDLEWSASGRNGLQKKPHALLPQVTAFSKTVNQFFNSFGLDPAAERRLTDVRQGDLFDGNSFGANGT